MIDQQVPADINSPIIENVNGEMGKSLQASADGTEDPAKSKPNNSLLGSRNQDTEAFAIAEGAPIVAIEGNIVKPMFPSVVL